MYQHRVPVGPYMAPTWRKKLRRWSARGRLSTRPRSKLAGARERSKGVATVGRPDCDSMQHLESVGNITQLAGSRHNAQPTAGSLIPPWSIALRIGADSGASGFSGASALRAIGLPSGARGASAPSLPAIPAGSGLSGLSGRARSRPDRPLAPALLRCGETIGASEALRPSMSEKDSRRRLDGGGGEAAAAQSEQHG